MCCYSTVLNLKKKKNILNELQLKSYVIDILLTLAKLFFIVVLGDKICVIFEFFIHSFIPVIIISFPRYFFSAFTAQRPNSHLR